MEAIPRIGSIRDHISSHTYNKGEAIFAEGVTADQGFKAVISVSLRLMSNLTKFPYFSNVAQIGTDPMLKTHVFQKYRHTLVLIYFYFSGTCTPDKN